MGSDRGSAGADLKPRFSLVVPVFNEGESIQRLLPRCVAVLPAPYELLICYDFDEDDTLPAIEALPASDKPPGLRLVRNELGRGVRYAIEAGMRAARADAVVVMMSDLSDDPADVVPIVERLEAGAAVVSASRHMAGGAQVGGPRLKKLLSWGAGLSLRYLAGLPTRDPTNSFRGYRRDFLVGQTIESPAGFSLGLELTVKAFRQGLTVEEVPTRWEDRTHGESRFDLVGWLPMYLKWYLLALRRPRA